MRESKRELNLRPFFTSHLGFDQLLDEIENSLSRDQVQENQTYPPFNVIKEANNNYTIEIAVAGLKKSDLQIQLNRKENRLVISCDKINHQETSIEQPRYYVKRGLARRAFSLAFTIDKNLEVDSAELDAGILTIQLQAIASEEQQPVMISIK